MYTVIDEMISKTYAKIVPMLQKEDYRGEINYNLVTAFVYHDTGKIVVGIGNHPAEFIENLPLRTFALVFDAIIAWDAEKKATDESKVNNQ